MNEDRSISAAGATLLARFKPYKGDCAEPNHGPYEGVSFPGVSPECPKCRTMREAIERSQHEDEEAQRRLEQALDDAGIIGRYRDATFGTFEAHLPRQRAVLDACRSFAKNFFRDQGAGLWLIGPAGVGKTHLGCAIAQAVLLQRGQSAVVATAREIIRALRDTWRRGSDATEGERIDRLGNVDLLVLDEIGIGFGSEGELTQLFDVIDRRYQLRRPTVLLSNLNSAQIKETVGDRLYERLREGATVMACNWASHRAKGPFIAGSSLGEMQ
jgi:DNA replication protein DnaC